MWTHFYDMHSGGGCKEPPYEHIFIEAPQDEASVIFYNRFGHNPTRVTCTCCGSDYSLTEGVSLKVLSGYERGCRALETPRNAKGLYEQPEVGTPEGDYFAGHYYLEDGEEPRFGFSVRDWGLSREYHALEDFVKRDDVLVICAADIKSEERVGNIPKQGYVWMD